MALPETWFFPEKDIKSQETIKLAAIRIRKAKDVNRMIRLLPIFPKVAASPISYIPQYTAKKIIGPAIRVKMFMNVLNIGETNQVCTIFPTSGSPKERTAPHRMPRRILSITGFNCPDCFLGRVSLRKFFPSS